MFLQFRTNLATFIEVTSLKTRIMMEFLGLKAVDQTSYHSTFSNYLIIYKSHSSPDPTTFKKDTVNIYSNSICSIEIKLKPKLR